MERELIWTETASSDILSIYRFVARRDPQAANRLAEGIYERAQVLLKQAEIGSPLLECSGWRKLIYKRWKIVCFIGGQRIIIGRVWPAAKGEVDFEAPLID